MCTSLEFNEFFGSSFDVPCFVFSSFVVQFSRYRSLPLFATAYLVYHTQFRLSRGFQNFFKFLFDIFVRSKSQFLASFRVLPVFLASRAPAPLRSFIILPLSSPFVNPFLHFFPFFPLFLPFLFDVSRFLEVFDRFLGVWMEGGGSFGGVFRPLFADARFDKPRNFQKVLIGVHEAAAAVR